MLIPNMDEVGDNISVADTHLSLSPSFDTSTCERISSWGVHKSVNNLMPAIVIKNGETTTNLQVLP
jgi:hypothetical protein